MKTHIPTNEQEKYFKKVVIAMKEAKKKGLVFYGKSDVLVAYTKEASDYQNIDFNKTLGTGYGTLPHLSAQRVLDDSGADDYASYLNESDEYMFNP